MCLRINYAIKRTLLIFDVYVHLGIIIDVTANLTQIPDEIVLQYNVIIIFSIIHNVNKLGT